MERLLAGAINDKQLVEFTYNGHLRIAEPHVLGLKSGKLQLLGFQVGGSSSTGGLPEWRRFDVQRTRGLRVLPQEFHGARTIPTGQHNTWDRRIAVVAP